MKIALGKRYKILPDFMESMPVRPATDVVKVISVQPGYVQFSDGRRTFQESINNFLIGATDVLFSTSAVSEKVQVVPRPEPKPVPQPTPEPIVVKPVEPTPVVTPKPAEPPPVPVPVVIPTPEPVKPVVTPQPEPVVAPEPPKPSGGNPYGDDGNYI